MSTWARRRARSVKSAKVWRRIDLSARRQTISWRGNTCSARRKIAERVSGKSIIRPFMRGLYRNREPDRVGTSYPAGRKFPPAGMTRRSNERHERPVSQRAAWASVVRTAALMLRSLLIDQAAEWLGVSRRTVYYRIREGRLRTVRTRCGSQRVLLDSVRALMREDAGSTDPDADVSGKDPSGRSPAI